VAGGNGAGVAGGNGAEAGGLPAGLPSRAAYLLAFLSVVVAGLFGGIIGYGIVDVGTKGAANTAKLLGTLIGAAGGAVGVGIIAVLVLRAMAEWKRRSPPEGQR
jgi:hypothetical protein